MTVLISALAFIVLLSVLILIHEWGHYITARLAGVSVEEFGVGLPPRARTLGYRKGTCFSLNWVPFGGFVRLQGESTTDPQLRFASGSFSAASVPWRIVILIAGVTMNLALAFVLLSIGFSVGKWVPTYTTIEDLERGGERGEVDLQWGVFVEDLAPGGPAEAAGVATGTFLHRVDGVAVLRPEDVVTLQQGKASVQYTLLRGVGYGEEVEIRVNVEQGKTGIALSRSPRVLAGLRRSPRAALPLALREMWVVTAQTVNGVRRLLGSIITVQEIPEEITGLVGIARITHASVQEGFLTYLRLVALLSLSLAALNILPFPALDGGRLLLVLIEVTLRRPINRHFEVALNSVGFALLFLLIIVVTMNDILRLLRP